MHCRGVRAKTRLGTRQQFNLRALKSPALWYLSRAAGWQSALDDEVRRCHLGFFGALLAHDKAGVQENPLPVLQRMTGQYPSMSAGHTCHFAALESKQRSHIMT